MYKWEADGEGSSDSKNFFRSPSEMPITVCEVNKKGGRELAAPRANQPTKEGEQVLKAPVHSASDALSLRATP